MQQRQRQADKHMLINILAMPYVDRMG